MAVAVQELLVVLDLVQLVVVAVQDFLMQLELVLQLSMQQVEMVVMKTVSMVTIQHQPMELVV